MPSELQNPGHELRDLASSISSAVEKYELATNGQDKTAALEEVRRTAQQLQHAATTPLDRFFDFNFQPMSQACVRIAIRMALFEHLPETRNEAISVEKLSSLTQSDMALTSRIVRALSVFGIINQDDKGLCWHAPTSRLYTDPPLRDWATWMFEGMLKGATNGISAFFDTKPYAIPSDARRTPFTLGHGEPGKDTFEVVRDVGLLPLLNSAMSGSSSACAQEAIASFDFASLQAGDDGLVLVDVGGAKGVTLQALRKAGLKGRIVLQDLESVLADGAVDGIDADLVPYNFFKQDQPIKGAAAYYYQRIFHDWDDAHCDQILVSLKPAMSEHSRLLICDVVVQDREPHPRKILRDINMLMAGGMERSQKQWEALLKRNGFELVAYHGLHNANNSIVEACVR